MSLAYRDFGYKPTTDLATGLRKFVKCYCCGPSYDAAQALDQSTSCAAAVVEKKKDINLVYKNERINVKKKKRKKAKSLLP